MNLNDPLQTEAFILGLGCKNKYKNSLLTIYQHYCAANNIKWQKPGKLPEDSYPVKIPTEERINMIISSATWKYAIVYNISKYGLRPDEVSKITLRDLDLEKGMLVVRTSKLGLERTLQLKREVIDMLRDYVALHRITSINQRLFASVSKIRKQWVKFRKLAFEKFKDPELLKIRLYDLRHWFATTMYLKTRDIFHVKYLLGHRNIQSTLVYMHIAKGLVNYSEDYTCKITSTIEEAAKLIEAGFEYVTTFDAKMLYRKRK